MCLHFSSWPSLRLTVVSPGLVHDTWNRKTQLSLPFNQGWPNPSSLLIRDLSFHQQLLLHRSFSCLINSFPWCHEIWLSFFLVGHLPSITLLLGSSCHLFLHGKWPSSYLEPLSYGYFFLIMFLSGVSIHHMNASCTCTFNSCSSRPTWTHLDIIQEIITLNQIVPFRMAFHHDIFL